MMGGFKTEVCRALATSYVHVFDIDRMGSSSVARWPAASLDVRPDCRIGPHLYSAKPAH